MKQRFIGHGNLSGKRCGAHFLGPTGDYIVSASDDNRLYIWEKRSRRLVRTLKNEKPTKKKKKKKLDGEEEVRRTQIFIGCRQTLPCFKSSTKLHLKKIDISCVKIVPETNNGFVFANNSQIYLYDVRDSDPKKIISCHSDKVFNLAFPEGNPNVLLSSSVDGTILNLLQLNQASQLHISIQVLDC
ncbi:hypothetical protein P8452_72735 [Trifolium repens]|nr:hypothetical protein P8452_72735 [Trifolium repens]